MLNFNDTAYPTAVITYNALNQVTLVRAHQGGLTGPYQEATYEYDGRVRLWKGKAPIQTVPTEYKYNYDDTVSEVKDARGVKTLVTYNGSRLPLTVTYDRGSITSVPTTVGTTSQGTTPVDATPPATYTYDAAGNRKTMTTENGAGGGGVTYAYDELSPALVHHFPPTF